jgi:hypothetical protein
VDVTQAFGRKWKVFFIELEEFHGLIPKRPGHIWLLHHLFLHQIDSDAQEFVAAWNHHKMQIRGERSASPREMFFFGMSQEGSRGVEDVQNFDEYGVDWDDYNDASFMRSLLQSNPDDTEEAGVFRAPEHIATVECEPPNCPLSSNEVRELDDELHRRIGNAFYSRDMNARRAVWEAALAITMDIVNRAAAGKCFLCFKSNFSFHSTSQGTEV